MSLTSFVFLVVSPESNVWNDGEEEEPIVSVLDQVGWNFCLRFIGVTYRERNFALFSSGNLVFVSVGTRT
jgi:hypothetical protein